VHFLFQNHKATAKPENEGALDQRTQAAHVDGLHFASSEVQNQQRSSSRTADVDVNRGTKI
jgi:hypothetical protein